jgi:hypothetical protein
MIRAALLVLLLTGCSPLRVTSTMRACLGICAWSERGAEVVEAQIECADKGR